MPIYKKTSSKGLKAYISESNASGNIVNNTVDDTSDITTSFSYTIS